MNRTDHQIPMSAASASIMASVESCYAAGLKAIDNGKLEQARVWAMRCEAAPGGTIDSRCALLYGTIATEAGDFDAAVPHFRRAAELAPEDATIARQLGEVLAASGALSEAVGVLEKAVRHAPDDVELLVLLAYVRMMIGDRPGACDALEQAILQPVNDAIRRSLAQICEALGEPALAAEILTHVARTAASPSVLSDLARLYLQLEHYPAAEAAFRSLQALDPEHELFAHHGQIWCRIKQQDWRGALDLALATTRIDRYEMTTALLAYAKDRLFASVSDAERREAELGARFMMQLHEHNELHSDDPIVGQIGAREEEHRG